MKKITILLMLTLFALTTYAADGDLDTSFNGNGKVATNGFFNDADSGGRGGGRVVIQPDGKIVTVGSKLQGNFRLVAATRYNVNGSLDASFGTNGVASANFVTTQFAAVFPVTVDLQTDGKILIAGTATASPSGTDFGVVRFNANGTLDTTFGNAGLVRTNVSTVTDTTINDTLTSLVFDKTQNKIYAAGTVRLPQQNSSSPLQGFAVVRYNLDGSLDATFNGTGKKVFPVSGNNNSSLNGVIGDIALQSDGKLIAVGETFTANAGESVIAFFAVTRINPDGSFDSAFGNAGFALTNFPSDIGTFNGAVATTVSILSNGKIFVGGTSDSGGAFRYVAAQYNTNGSLDTSFGTGGRVRAEGFEIYDSAIQPNGKIVVTGKIGGLFGVGRLNANGSPDTSFGTNGVRTTNFTPETSAVGQSFGIALQTDGKIIVSGNENANSSGGDYILLARYGDGLPNALLNFTGLQNGEYTREFYNGGAGSLGSVGGTNYNVSFPQTNTSGLQSGIVETNFTSPQIRTDARNVILNVPKGLKRVSFKYARALADDNASFACAARVMTGLDAGGTELKRVNLPLTNTALGMDTAQQPITTLEFSGTARSLEFICSASRVAIDDIALNIPETTNQALQVADFDGDGKSDASVFRSGNWFVNPSTAPGGFYSVQFGLATDKLVPADFDGDGKTDVAVWREESNAERANFYIFNSSNSTVRVEQFGRTGDNPIVVGDWDGDGKADLAVYRPGAAGGGQSLIFYRPSSQPGVGFITLYWGINGDEPVRGDFDGDNRIDAAVFRPSNQTWYIRQSSNNQIRFENWGIASDKRVSGDFDGDGKTDLTVFRDGVWYVKQSSNNQPLFRSWGLNTDKLAAGDYDGDGKTDFTVWRNGIYYIAPANNSAVDYRYFGTNGDIPVASVFVP